MEVCKEIFIGIDVSKDSLDICCQGKESKIGNNSRAIKGFLKSIMPSNGDDLEVQCVMEHTGGYERLAFNLIHESGIKVKVEHPNKVHAFAKLKGHFAKTDKLDAKLLYNYAQFLGSDFKPTIPSDAIQQQIKDLHRVAVHIEEKQHAAQCFIKQVGEGNLYLKQELKMYAKHLEQIYAKIDALVDEDESLKVKKKAMMQVTGVGNKVANQLIASIPELGTLNRGGAARLVGVAPRTNQSGLKESRGKIHGGRFYARKAIYMVALVGMRHNAVLKERYHHLLKQGKLKKIALIALMRKVAIFLNTSIKRAITLQRENFDVVEGKNCG